jgi:tripartite-type tricarboxylate transporter receptor subunit TctC
VLPPALGNLQAGTLRAIAMLSRVRFSLLPDVPTAEESGMPGFEAVLHYGLLAPAGTPKPIVDKMVAELQKTVKLPDVQKTLTETLGMDVVALGPADTQKWLVDNMARWGKVVKDNNIHAE